MSLSNMTITLPSLLVPLSVTLYHHETCMHSLCVFVSDHKQDLCFASKVSHKSRMPVFSLRQSIKKVLQCVTNVLFFWFALLLFVNPGKLTLPLNICATSDVLICSIFYPPLYVPTTEKECWEIMKYRMKRAKTSGDIYLTEGWLHLGNSNMGTRWWTGRETGLCWWIGWQWGSHLHQNAPFYSISWWIVGRSLSVFDLLSAINDCLNCKRIFEYRF